MNKFPVSEDNYMATYAIASIGVQNPVMNRIFTVGKYSGKGPAKITDAEMETTYGVNITDADGGDRGTGLGLRTEDNPANQYDLTVAFTAMAARIQVRLDKCQVTKYPCTTTDIFLIAAFGGDAAIAPDVVRDLGNGVYGKPDPDTGILPWKNFLKIAENREHDLKVLQQFVNNVWYLQEKGAAVPNVNWTYICSLLK
jgi:hypothetical protein